MLKKALDQPALALIANYRLAKIAAISDRPEDLNKKYKKAIMSSTLAKNTTLMSELCSREGPGPSPYMAKALAQSGMLFAKPQSLCPFFELDARAERGAL